jgi:hypothetical protein
MGPDRSGEHHRLHSSVIEHVVERRRPADRRVPAGDLSESVGALVTDDRDLGRRELVEIANEVRAPVAQTNDRDTNGAHAPVSGL